MTENRFFAHKRTSAKRQYLQVLFVFLAFGLMALTSFLFGLNLEREHLENQAEAMFIGIESLLEADLKELETMMSTVSETIRLRLLGGAELEEMKVYISGITDYGHEKNIPGFLSVFAYFNIPGQIDENVFSAASPDTNWHEMEAAGLITLESRDWYLRAIEAGGDVAVTQPYLDFVTGEVTFTYVRSLYDDNGNLISVVCLNVLLDRIYEFSASTHSYGNHSWMLLDRNLTIVAFPFPEFLGAPLAEAHETGLSDIAALLEQGLTVSGHRFYNYDGDEKVISIRQLENEWFLGVASPVDSYYENLWSMLWFLILLGLVMASVLSIILIRVLAGREKAVAAREAAKESNRYKSEFLSHISHEIRTPINAVLGTAEIELQKETITPDVEEAFGRVYSSGNLLLNIINDLLDLSKVEAGKLELIPTKYELSGLIYDTMQLNLMRHESKPIEFNLKIDENTPHDLFGDELRIKQVLNNILSNAFKYTDTGEIELSVSAETFDEATDASPGRHSDCVLILRVSDTGQGMTEEQIGKLFEEYTRFNTDVNRTTIGTGLGMTITKRLLDIMSGHIFIESSPGKGSVFTVRLPQKCIGSAVCGPEMAERLHSNRFQNMLKLRKAKIAHEYMPYGSILIVDDVESNLYVAKGMMMPYGLKIETASSGYKAVDKIREGNEYDIVFMDHMMPRMNGIEATKIIRDMGYKSPVIALTANAATGQSEMFINNGFDGYISKPIDMRELNVYLNRFIRDKHSTEEVEAARQQMRQGKLDSGKGHKAGRKEELMTAIIIDMEHTLSVLEDLVPKLNVIDAPEMALFTTTVHGIKSALLHIGETEMSAVALKLEVAGNDRNIDEISARTPAFMQSLRSIIDQYKLRPADAAAEKISHDDMAFLQEKLAEIKTACEQIRKSAAKAALDELKQKAWPRTTNGLLDEISVYLLHGEFKKVVAAVEKATMKTMEK